MGAAIRNVLAVSISVLICLAFTWLYLRNKGYEKTLYDPVRHPFLEVSEKNGRVPYLIAFRGSSAIFPENTLPAFDHAAALDPNLILWVDVRPTKDLVLVVFNQQSLNSTTEGSGWVGYTDFRDLHQLNAGYRFQASDGSYPYRDQLLPIPTLKEVLERYPDRRLILNFSDYKPGLDKKIIELIDQLHAGSRVLIQSREQGLLKDLREQKPEWLFGSSQVQMTLLKMLTSIGLQSMTPLEADVYIAELNSELNPQPASDETHLLSEASLAELKRRKLPVFVGPLSEPDLAASLLDQGVDGIITATPSTFIP